MAKSKDRHPFLSLVPSADVVSLHGKIYRNPSKTDKGAYYSCMLEVELVSGKSAECFFTSSASGRVKMLVPSRIAEASYPGRLYSKGDGNVLFEAGERISCRGKFSPSGFFMADSCMYSGFEKTFWGRMSHLRALSRLAFKRLMFSWGDTGGFILSLLSGSREYLEKGLGENFRRAGLSHILALSGMHLSFFAGLAGGGGKTLLGKRYSFWAKFAGILFFVWFAGLSPSLFRALLCSSIALLCGILFCVSIDSFAVLCGVFIIHIVVFPEEIFSAGFMLSYSALGGILLFSEAFKCFFGKIFPPVVSEGLSASAAAQTATFPVSALLFGSCAPVGVISTLFVSPLIGIFLCASVLSIILSLVFPQCAEFCGIVLQYIYILIKKLVWIFSYFPPLNFG